MLEADPQHADAKVLLSPIEKSIASAEKDGIPDRHIRSPVDLDADPREGALEADRHAVGLHMEHAVAVRVDHDARPRFTTMSSVISTSSRSRTISFGGAGVRTR